MMEVVSAGDARLGAGNEDLAAMGRFEKLGQLAAVVVLDIVS